MNGVARRWVVLLLLLFSGLGFLCIEAEIPVQPKFDLKKFAGQWYPISAVTNKGHPMNYVAPAPTFEVRKKKELSWSTDTPVEVKKCKKKTYDLPQLDRPGKYKMETDKIIRIVETDYTGYSIHHRESPDSQLLSLYARTKEASAEVEKKFKNSAKSLGFAAYKIYPIRLAEQCAEPKIYVS